jgi:DNA-directed RNA polymerase I, II, and III subunit RPABC2
MSDLEEESDIEQDADAEIDSDKEEKEMGLSKPIVGKKLTAEYDSEDNEEDNVDDTDDEIPSDEELDISQDDKGDEYNQFEDKGETNTSLSPIDSEIDSEDEDYLQKFEPEAASEYIKTVHPECLTSNSVEIESLTIITRDKNNRIIDENHLTSPFLSKYERTRILGQRAKQINIGHKPYVKVPPGIIDGYLIAELELKEKKIPVIIRRPLPGGKSEYWKLQDLEQIY